jgi:hypothetical protein
MKYNIQGVSHRLIIDRLLDIDLFLSHLAPWPLEILPWAISARTTSLILQPLEIGIIDIT